MNPSTAEFCALHGACAPGRDWAAQFPNMASAWEALIAERRHDWLIWTATCPGVFDDRTLRLMVIRFVRETPIGNGRYVVDLLTDPRSLAGLNVAERYAQGQASLAELSAAEPPGEFARLAARGAVEFVAKDAGRFAARAAAEPPGEFAARAAALSAMSTLSAQAAQIAIVASYGNPFQGGA